MNARKISKRRWLLLPLEVKVREFEAKVMLSSVAAEKGFGVLLGRNGFNTKGKYPQGVYLDKSISPNKYDTLDHQTRLLGNKLASLDEEGVVYKSELEYLKTRTSASTVEMSSAIYTWGYEQKRLIDEAYLARNKLVVTGSPRADLWLKPMHFLYQSAVEDLRRRFGDFILVPSNFSAPINANGTEFIVNQYIDNGYVSSEKEKALLMERIAYQHRIFHKFVEMIPAVAAKNPDLRLVIRPHPGDNIEVWRRLSKAWPKNVVVIYEGNITPWIIASKVLIHNSCTTAVEAYAMGKPVIAYMPYVDQRFDQNIPNPLSQPAKSLAEVLALVGQNLSTLGLGFEIAKQDIFERHITVSEQEWAADRIVSNLHGMDLPEQEFSWRISPIGNCVQKSVVNVKQSIIDLTGRSKYSRAYRKQKNPGIRLAEIKEVMEAFMKNKGCWKNVCVEKVASDIFCFWSE